MLSPIPASVAVTDLVICSVVCEAISRAIVVAEIGDPFDHYERGSWRGVDLPCNISVSELKYNDTCLVNYIETCCPQR